MTLTKKQLLSLIFLIGLVFSIFVAIFLVKQRQELRKKAAGVAMTITLYPVQETLVVGQPKVFELKATFTNGSSTEKLDYLKTELTFSPNYIKVPDGKSIDTSASGFGKIILVDEPTAANEAGKIILELGALSLGGGPATDKPITIAKLYFEGKGVTPSSQDVKIGKTQVVNSQSSNIDVSSQGAKYSVSLSAIDTPTPTTPTPTPCVPPIDCAVPPANCNYVGGNSCSCGQLVCTPTPNKVSWKTDYVSLEADDFYIEANGQKFFGKPESGSTMQIHSDPGNPNYTTLELIWKENGVEMRLFMYFNADGTNWWSPEIRTYNGVPQGDWVYYVGGKTPGVPLKIFNSPLGKAYIGDFNLKQPMSLRLCSLDRPDLCPKPTGIHFGNLRLLAFSNVVPTPPPGEEKYKIDVGNKQWLTINIGTGQIAQIRFKAKLSHVQKTPEMYLKLRVKDELAFMNTNFSKTAAGSDSCNNTPNGAFDFWIPVKADSNGVYSPNATPSSSLQTPSNASVPIILSDGWVELPGVTPGKYLSFYLKGPKTRSTKVAEHIQLVPNEKQSAQDFDWTANTLDPGDLPDPNKSLRQDCTVNSIDLSLITARLGKTDPDSLAVADVNYDVVVNGNDVSKVVNTLSTKPDDDQ